MANPRNKSSVVALSVSVYSKVSPAMWHGCLGHPFSKLLKFLAGSGLLSLSSSLPSKFTCESCLCNKRKRLPFGESSLESCGPLDLVYTDVWGLSLIESIDGFHYYVIFVDHFTKYIWIYPLRLKSYVFPIFCPFKAVVEFFFNRPIISIYLDGGGEYVALKYFSRTFGIQHLKTPPHTPQHLHHRASSQTFS